MQGAYLTLGQFTTPQHWRNAAIIVTVVALGGTGLWAYSTVTETQKRQKYQRAYEEVQKMKWAWRMSIWATAGQVAWQGAIYKSMQTIHGSMHAQEVHARCGVSEGV